MVQTSRAKGPVLARLPFIASIGLASLFLLFVPRPYLHLSALLCADRGQLSEAARQGSDRQRAFRDSGPSELTTIAFSRGGLTTSADDRIRLTAAGFAPLFGPRLLSSAIGLLQGPLLAQAPGSLPGLRVVDGQKYPKTDAGIQAAINDAGRYGTVLLPPAWYTLAKEITVTNEGVTIQGYGMGTRLQVTDPIMNVFTVSGPLFALRDLEIYTSVPKTAGAVINVKAMQGQVSNVRLVGNFYNGFELIGQMAGIWTFNDIRVPGGVTWNRLFFLQSSSATIASTQVHNLICANTITWKDACVVLDTGMDTFLISDSEFGGPATGIHCRNTLHGQAPRWVQVKNSYMEGGFAGTIVKLDAVRDFRYQGYLASGAVGVDIGPEAKNVDISHTIFVNIGHEAVKVHRGSSGVSIAYNTFEDTCHEANNACDTILVDSGTSNFRIESNDFRSSMRNLPRYNINVLPGSSNNYSIVNNRFGDAAAGGLADGGTGRAKVSGGNIM